MSWRNRDTISQNLFARWFIADVSIYWLSAIDELQWDFSFHFRFEWGAYLPNVVVRSQRSYFALITLSFHWFTQCLFFRENQRTIIICRIVYVNRKCVCVCFFFLFFISFIYTLETRVIAPHLQNIQAYEPKKTNTPRKPKYEKKMRRNAFPDLLTIA